MRGLAIAIWLAAVLLLALAVPLNIADRDAETGADDDSIVIGLLFLFEILAFASVGAYLALRRPANVFGWLLAMCGLVGAIGSAADAYARHALYVDASLPAGRLAAWIANFVIDTPGFAFGFFGFLFLLFPDGRWPSQFWRRAVWLIIPALAALQVIMTLNPGELNAFSGVENPLGIAAVGSLAFLEAPLFLLLLGFVVVAVVSLIRRFVRARGAERERFKLVAAACAFLAATLASGPLWWFAVPSEAVGEVAWPVLFASALASLPVAIGVSVLRYRLYDIDRILNRTLVYALLTALLAVLYFGLVVALQAASKPVSGSSDLAIALTTLIVAALFLPARQRVQALVDRRFNRRAYDAARTIEGFGVRLRQQVDLDTLRYELLTVVDETMEPSRMTLWLRPREGPS